MFPQMSCCPLEFLKCRRFHKVAHGVPKFDFIAVFSDDFEIEVNVRAPQTEKKIAICSPNCVQIWKGRDWNIHVGI